MVEEVRRRCGRGGEDLLRSNVLLLHLRCFLVLHHGHARVTNAPVVGDLTRDFGGAVICFWWRISCPPESCPSSPIDFPNFDDDDDDDDDDDNDEEEHIESLRLGKAADATDLAGRSFLLLRFPSSFGPSSPLTSPISTSTTTTTTRRSRRSRRRRARRRKRRRRNNVSAVPACCSCLLSLPASPLSAA